MAPIFLKANLSIDAEPKSKWEGKENTSIFKGDLSSMIDPSVFYIKGKRVILRSNEKSQVFLALRALRFTRPFLFQCNA